MLVALKAFGFGSMKGIAVEDFQNPDMVVMLGNPPVRIDLMTSISGCSFERAWKRRPKDLLDVEALAQLPKTKKRR